jgi:hypothetical protein
MQKHCLFCGLVLNRHNKIYCSNKCQSDFLYTSFIKRYLDGFESGYSVPGISRHVRRWLFETRGRKCENCGWDKIHPTTKVVPVEVDHVNGDWKNCRPENLKILCPNCHSLTITFRNLNKGKGRELRLCSSNGRATDL